MTKIQTDEGQLFWGEFDRMAERLIVEAMAEGKSGGTAIEAVLRHVDAAHHEEARVIATGVIERIAGPYHNAADVILGAERLLAADVNDSPSHVREYIPILERTCRDPQIPWYQQQKCAQLARAPSDALHARPRGGVPGSGCYGE